MAVVVPSAGLVADQRGGALKAGWLKVLCQSVDAMNEAHKVALRNFLEGSMSKVLHFRLNNLEYMFLGTM